MRKKKPPNKVAEKTDRAFRYAIVDNSLRDKENPTIVSREVDVLLEKRAFSEANLKTLLALVSNRFPSPSLLFVHVYTDLDQVLTPEEQDAGIFSRSNQEPEITSSHYWAIYIRDVNDEFFRYSPVNDRAGNKLVQLKIL